MQSPLVTHSFVRIDGDVERSLELSNHAGDKPSLEVDEIGDDEEHARVLTHAPS